MGKTITSAVNQRVSLARSLEHPKLPLDNNFAELDFVVLQKIRRYPPELPSVNLDTYWIDRRDALAVVRGLARVAGAVIGPVERAPRRGVTSLLAVTARAYSRTGLIGGAVVDRTQRPVCGHPSRRPPALGYL